MSVVKKKIKNVGIGDLCESGQLALVKHLPVPSRVPRPLGLTINRRPRCKIDQRCKRYEGVSKRIPYATFGIKKV